MGRDLCCRGGALGVPVAGEYGLADSFPGAGLGSCGHLGDRIFVRGRVGSALAVLALLFGFPALALYNASLAVFAVVIAGLRLVRAR